MKKFCLSLFFTSCFFALAAQLTFIVNSIPQNTPSDATIYVAGTFNGWDAENANYALSLNQDGEYTITLNPDVGQVKFKFTRGGWATVEGNENGNFLPDRVFNYTGNAQTVEIEILSWEDLSGNNSGGTAAANVQIIDESFFMPQLNRNRRIWVYLPPDYESSNKNYPVLYMHDGQNVFDANTSFSGEWEVDESLNALFENGDDGIIVVAIDNGGANRFNEYSPWVYPQYGGGQGDEYMAFIVETLKPHIDQQYRTRPERDYTGLMGSSMGGLITLYGAIEYQEVFSKAGVFSPSFWVAPDAYTHVSTTGKEADMRIYLLAGEQESASMVPDMQEMYTTLIDAGFAESELFFNTHADGQHSEWYWAREFQGAYSWLYANTNTTSTAALTANSIRISPNPADSVLRIDYEEAPKNLRVEILGMDGRLVQKRKRVNNQEVNVSNLSNGTFILNFYSKRQLLGTHKLVVLHQ